MFKRWCERSISLLGHLVGGNDILNSRSHACNNAAKMPQ